MKQTGAGQCLGKACEVDTNMIDAYRRQLKRAVVDIGLRINTFKDPQYASMQNDRLQLLVNEPTTMRAKADDLADILSSIIIDFEDVYSRWATIKKLHARLQSIDPSSEIPSSEIQTLINEAKRIEELLLQQGEAVRQQLKQNGGRLMRMIKGGRTRKSKVLPVK